MVSVVLVSEESLCLTFCPQNMDVLSSALPAPPFQLKRLSALLIVDALPIEGARCVLPPIRFFPGVRVALSFAPQLLLGLL